MLSPEEVLFLEEVVARLAELDARWSRLEEVCDGAPRTLVHGDFNGKNVRLRAEGAGSAFLVFDWEDAGWGIPAVDLAQQQVPSSNLCANPDIPTYASTVRERWPDASTEDWRRLATCGTVFRVLAALFWGSSSLGTEWASSFVTNMRLYDAEMAHALARLDGDGWDAVPAGTRASAGQEP